MVPSFHMIYKSHWIMQCDYSYDKNRIKQQGEIHLCSLGFLPLMVP